MVVQERSWGGQLADDVIDSGGLELGFDFESGLYHVFADDLSLAPDETRTFEVVLKNKWSLDKAHLFSLKVYAQSIATALEGFKESDRVQKLKEKTMRDIDELMDRKSESEFTEQHVVVYRKDKEKLEEIKKGVRKIEDISLQAGIMPGMAIVEKEMLCEEEEEKRKKGTGTIGGLNIKEIKLMAGTIFKGKSLSTVATWRIIYYIIAFLGTISAVFYFLNIRQRKSTMFDPLTGAFSRGYIFERFWSML